MLENALKNPKNAKTIKDLLALREDSFCNKSTNEFSRRKPRRLVKRATEEADGSSICESPEQSRRSLRECFICLDTSDNNKPDTNVYLFLD
jgi:hypothetical protein